MNESIRAELRKVNSAIGEIIARLSEIDKEIESCASSPKAVVWNTFSYPIAYGEYISIMDRRIESLEEERKQLFAMYQMDLATRDRLNKQLEELL